MIGVDRYGFDWLSLVIVLIGIGTTVYGVIDGLVR